MQSCVHQGCLSSGGTILSSDGSIGAGFGCCHKTPEDSLSAEARVPSFPRTTSAFGHTCPLEFPQLQIRTSNVPQFHRHRGRPRHRRSSGRGVVMPSGGECQRCARAGCGCLGGVNRILENHAGCSSDRGHRLGTLLWRLQHLYSATLRKGAVCSLCNRRSTGRLPPRLQPATVQLTERATCTTLEACSRCLCGQIHRFDRDSRSTVIFAGSVGFILAPQQRSARYTVISMRCSDLPGLVAFASMHDREVRKRSRRNG